VDRVVRLIVKRRRHALLPPFAGLLLALDGLVGGHIGDAVLAAKFPPEQRG
jgi:hypothetical protein